MLSGLILTGFGLEVLARAAREAIRSGADPELALSYVIWPDDELLRRHRVA